MENSSFYGGRRGTPFILKARYDSIQDMINAFSKGGAYEDVRYDEYVIIDTPNKDNADNGKIFKRGYSYTDEMGGAQYLGQIVGPSGAAANLILDTYENVSEMEVPEGSSYKAGTGEYAPTENLVPGKDGDVYNDSIKWAYCSIKDANSTEVNAYIGFTFPYPVLEIEGLSTSPYDKTNLVTRVDDQTHPFYQKIQVKIPGGIKGDSIKNFRVMTADDTVQSYEGQQDDIDNQRQILVYDYVTYEDSPDGTSASLYIGDFNMIKEMQFDEDGTIRVLYTHGDEQVISTVARWISAVHLSETGKLTIDFTTGETVPVENTIKWVKSIALSDDGNLVVTYNDSTTETIQDSIKWITNVSLDNNGVFKVDYSHGTPSYTTTLRYPRDAYVDIGTTEGQGTQKLQITYSDNSTEYIGNPLNYIMKVAITDDDYHCLLLYSDPVKRQEAISQGKNREYDGRNDWYDLGSIKDASGILIGTNYETSHFTDPSNLGIATQLNQELPNGFPQTDVDKFGKIITVGAGDEQRKFFAFDYDKKEDGAYKGWYYIGEVTPTTETQGIIVGEFDDPDLIQQAKDLPIGTVWMIVED